MNLTEKRNLEKSLNAIAARRLASYKSARSTQRLALERQVGEELLAAGKKIIDKCNKAAEALASAVSELAGAGLKANNNLHYNASSSAASYFSSASVLSSRVADATKEFDAATEAAVEKATETIEEAVIDLWSGEIEIGELVKKLDAIFA